MTLLASVHPKHRYPELTEVDHWIPLEHLYLHYGYIGACYEESLFEAIEFALAKLGDSKLIVLSENRKNKLCVNPLLLEGICTYFSAKERGGRGKKWHCEKKRGR